LEVLAAALGAWLAVALLAGAAHAEGHSTTPEGSSRAHPEAAREAPPIGSALFGQGTKQIGLGVGYGHGLDCCRAGASLPDLDGVRFVEVLPRIGIQPLAPIGSGWYRNNVDVILEGTFIANTNPGGYAVGATAVLRWNFLGGERLVPFVDGFMGPLAYDMDLPNQADGLIFNVGGGGGFYWFLRDGTALTGELRFQHLSNAYTLEPNRGINDLLFIVSVTRFWR
jgi:hypothetical protein